MDNWQILETSFDPLALHHKETVFTIGNGYLGTRGAFEEGYPGEQPATLIHGLFDDIPIVYTELVNSPNWVQFDLIVNGERFRMDRGKVLSYRRTLDLGTGTLARDVRWQSPAGDVAEIHIERFTSLDDEHVLGIRYRVTALDLNGELEFRAGLPGYVDNAGWVHWEWIEQGRSGKKSAYLQLQTKKTRIRLCEAFHLDLAGGGDIQYEYWDSRWAPTLVARVKVKPGETVIADKLVTVFTSRDTEDPQVEASRKLTLAAEQGYTTLRAASDIRWKQEWEESNILIEGDDQADRALRYSLFQLLIAAPRHDERVSIPAKALSGFGYRGHVFWDTDIFILPFFAFTRPAIARNLLMYRYHTLAGARRKAQSNGYQGAMYAWESAATGDETTPRWVPGPRSDELIRIWTGDIEHQITADVAYALIQYWRVTRDDDFMHRYGAEILLDTAHFWGSRVEWNKKKGYYELTNVIGPDEYHDHVDNNAYTNNLVRWNLETAFEVLDWLRAAGSENATRLEAQYQITPQLLSLWKDIIAKLYLGYDPQTGLFEQFEGFFQRKDANLKDYEPRTQSMQALLGIEGVQEYQIIKQPDVLMLLYLLRPNYDQKTIKANWDYYTPRTDITYGSSLGPPIQAALSAHFGDLTKAYQHFILAARTDLDDVRGNAGDGIHAATAGGLWQAAVFGFGGLQINESGPVAKPHLPPLWKRLQFRIRYHGEPYDFDLRTDSPGTGETSRAAATAVPGSPQLPVQGAIFDLDGVLTDTSEFHYLGWKRLAGEEGIPFNRQDNEALRGVDRRESLLRLLKGRSLPEEQMQEMMARKNRYYLEFIEGLTPEDLLPGANDLLLELRQAGVKVAIGSASKNARKVIDGLGIMSLVDAVSDGYSVESQKPAPDLFLNAAGQLGLEPGHCVVFEDAEAGIEAALAGGMWVVGIGPQERVGSAHVVLPGLEGVTWANLLERLAQAQPAPSPNRPDPFT